MLHGNDPVLPLVSLPSVCGIVLVNSFDDDKAVGSNCSPFGNLREQRKDRKAKRFKICGLTAKRGVL
jgi:hypothetical protein